MAVKKIENAVLVTPEMVNAALNVFYAALANKQLRESRDRYVSVRTMIEAALDAKESA